MGEQCKILIFDALKDGDTPSSEIHMELEAGFERFWNDAKSALDELCIDYIMHDEFLIRIECGAGNYFVKGYEVDEYGSIVNSEFELIPDNEKAVFRCSFDEEVLVYTLLCYCQKSAAAVRRFCYNGSEYTDISDMEILNDVVYSSYDDSSIKQSSFKFAARKDGCNLSVYYFGDGVITSPDDRDGDHCWPPSNGLVEAKENRIYIGTYCYEDEFETDIGDINIIDHDKTSLHVFFETDGKAITFSVLIDGKLYKKISSDDETVTFYHTPFDPGRWDPCKSHGGVVGRERKSLKTIDIDYADETWKLHQGENPEDIIFRNSNGRYLYSVGNKAEKGEGDIEIELPRQDFEGIDAEGARRLYEAYISALYDAFLKEKRCITNDGVLESDEGDGRLFCCTTEDFEVVGKFVGPEIKYFEMNYAAEVERIVFSKDGIKVALLPKRIPNGDIALEIEVSDTVRKEQYCETFDKIKARGVFDRAGLPETLQFDIWMHAFAKNIEIYKKIKAAIINFGAETLFKLMSRMLQIDRKDMERTLYEDGMVPDADVIDFALSMYKEYGRTGKISNIALIGEAGTGKSTIAKKFGAVFGKEVMNISPSELKGAYIGQTAYQVVDVLAQAAERKQIIFIDEAYTLMSDGFGQEAVSLLLPLMSGDRNDVYARVDELGEISIDFKKGEIVKRIGRDGEPETTEIVPGVPPIWFGGYEDDIRLMINLNQGLFRRIQRVKLKAPSTDKLYEKLTKILEDAIHESEKGENSKLFDCGSMSEESKKETEDKMRFLLSQYRDEECKQEIIKFFRWGTQPQNSKYFANYAGVERFLGCCLDRIDFSGEDFGDKRSRYIVEQIMGIIKDIKNDIKRQLDTIRRKGNGQEDSDCVEMIFENDTRFTDLIGCDSQIKYMKEIIDMFVRKDDYEKQNITVPKGALLLGAPGVGKTFIARAMAGELQQKFEEEAPNKRVGFMSLSAPELTSKPVSFIGSIFDKAEEYDACVIFIDEVDAIAKNRFQNENYSHFIELIKQMDGIERRSNVFILAATNARESLDPAFTRSGRIDKELFFTLPDSEARRKLAEISIRKRKNGRALTNILPEEFERDMPKLTKEIAAITRGYTPGDIENIVNTAFIMYDQKPDMSGGIGPEFGSTRLKYLYSLIYEAVETNDIGELNRAKKEKTFSVDKNDQSCSSVSVHEVGHALVGILCGHEPFEKITSLPRGDALGYVMPARNALLTKKDYENRIRTSMGGRIAEEIVYGKDNISAGASGDMKNATYFARIMVEELGFADEFEFMALTETVSRHLGVSGYNCSESFRKQSDRAVNELLKNLYQETREMLADKKELIITLARNVFQKETMSGEDFYELYEKENNKYNMNCKK